MPSISTLRNAINQQLSDAESKRILVNSLMKTAQQHESSGDDARAKLDRDSAERYLRDLHGIEKTIADYESEITKHEQKAKELDRRIDELNERYKHDLEGLENNKKSIMADILKGYDNKVILDQLKNSSINHKEKELQKHYKHDLQKLIDEQKFVLG